MIRPMIRRRVSLPRVPRPAPSASVGASCSGWVWRPSDHLVAELGENRGVPDSAALSPVTRCGRPRPPRPREGTCVDAHPARVRLALGPGTLGPGGTVPGGALATRSTPFPCARRRCEWAVAEEEAAAVVVSVAGGRGRRRRRIRSRRQWLAGKPWRFGCVGGRRARGRAAPGLEILRPSPGPPVPALVRGAETQTPAPCLPAPDSLGSPGPLTP